MIARFLEAGRYQFRCIVFGLIALIAVADWAVGNRASLGILYVVPMVLAATAFRSAQVAALALLCSSLKWCFDIPAPTLEVWLRFLFSFLTYSGAGLLVIAVTQVRHEQGLRKEAEEQLDTLVESSPAAIITVDGAGIIIAANKAAHTLLTPSGPDPLQGKAIAPYIPLLANALQFDSDLEGLRTATQCTGYRDNGEVFLANLWFSSWTGPQGKRLAAIVVDSSEEMREREEENLRQILRANQIGAAAISHEVRNLCGAISTVSANLGDHAMDASADMKALGSLVRGLERIASLDLQARAGELLPEDISLRSVLEDLRIVAEPQWREVGGSLRLTIPKSLPAVRADRYGLLQAFLNLSRNSLRAVQQSRVREFSIAVCLLAGKILIHVSDSGPGVIDPDSLFIPFHRGSQGAGLGLYVSRAVLRSFGGDLRWEPSPQSSRFVIELVTAPGYES